MVPVENVEPATEMDGTSGAGSDVRVMPPWPPPTVEVPLAQELADRHRTIAVLQARAYSLAGRARRALTASAWWWSDDGPDPG